MLKLVWASSLIPFSQNFSSPSPGFDSSLLWHRWPLTAQGRFYWHVPAIPPSWASFSSHVLSSGEMIKCFVLYLAFTVADSEMFFWYLTSFNCWNLFRSNQRHNLLLTIFFCDKLCRPQSLEQTQLPAMCILENKTSPERERILTSSSWNRAKHSVEQREQLKGELIHQMLHEMRMDEIKLSINQVHCVLSGKRCPSPFALSQQRIGNCCRKYIFKLHWEKTLWKRSSRGN